MNIINKRLSLKEFREYVDNKNFGIYPPKFIVLHHTWKPVEEDGDGTIEPGEWNGQKTIDGLKRYYEGKGWSAGPHLFIADDGIWLFTDMYDVGIHAGSGNGDMKSGYSIGIEVVGNYDNKVWDEETKINVLGALKILMDRLKIPENKIMFHRDYQPKTCPGKMITKEWVINQLKEEIMEKEFVNSIKNITGKDYGESLNEKEQKDAAKRIDNIDAQFRQQKTMIQDSEKKVAEYSGQLQQKTYIINEQSKQIEELTKVKNNGVAALGVIKLLQEAIKQLINFKF